jgi:type IV pilus assembly protein PilN
MVYLTFSMNHKISSLNGKIEVAQAEFQKYEAIAKRVKKIKGELRKLEGKMDIIVKLEANRTGPVRFMDALTNFVKPERMWLTGVSESQGSMKLSGVAVDNKIIADFMTGLEGSPYFQKVDLVSSKQVALKGDRKFKEFTITCNVGSEEPQNRPTKS